MTNPKARSDNSSSEEVLSETASQKTSQKTSENNWQVWYNDFDKNYGPYKRKSWYSSVATAYRWARPRYPDALIDRVIQSAGLKAGDTVLEMGCGPGIATRSFAARGLAMQSVEPSSTACELARKACHEFDNVTVVNSTFEDFSLNEKRFDAVLAATSFHWVAPDVACQKSAAALKPGGSLILLWATPPQPDESLCQYLQPVYERHQLTDQIRYQWRGQDYYQANFERFSQVVGESEWFEQTNVEIAQHHSTYSIEKYLALLSTLSDYIALPLDVRTQLLKDLGERLSEKKGDQPLPLVHWFAAQVAPLIAKTDERKG
ncbi:MAG: class I SAM-dependent methyltransferase [Cyanobacteria bacterium J06621_11]